MSGAGLSGIIGGSGGNKSSLDVNNAAARSEAQKQAARNAVNAAFGVAPSLDNLTPGAFQYASKNNDVSLNTNNGHIFNGGFLGGSQNLMDFGGALFGGGTKYHNATDQAAYAAAKAEYDKEVADAEANKTARQSLYDTVRTDAFNAGKTGLDDTKTTAARNNKFALFAQGLNGGSADIDENALLGRTYDQGLLDLGAKADLAKSTLQGNDETTRLGLLQSVDNGMNTSDALQSALTQMKTGADSAEAQAQGTNLGDLFANAGLLYTKSNAARGSQAGMNYFASLFPQSAQLSGGKSNGIVTSTGG